MKQKRFKAIIAVHVFLIQDGHVLLQRRADTGYEDGNYSVPAGHLDGGETVAEAAARELFEETGIAAKTSDFAVVHTMHRQVVASAGHRHERIDFFCSVATWQGEPRIAEPDKCDDLIWSDIHQLPSNTIPYIRDAFTSFRDQSGFSQFGWSDAA